MKIMWKYSCKYHKCLVTSPPTPPSPPPSTGLFGISWFSQNLSETNYIKSKSEIKKQFFHLVHKSEKFTWIRFCCNCLCSVHFDHSLLTGLFVFSTAAQNKTTTSTSDSNSTKFANSQISLSVFCQNKLASRLYSIEYHSVVVNSN